ncbi:MAG: ABC transporter ATP-binding protein [Desulfobacterales bacterium]|jgi:ABC-type Fe3+/spermidine/putrescine transport system ATPase subunit|nr:ABC transporter ATP-binding protein [Desulfobacterales bacterium]MDH3826062.1 ABC transporter ATP-binding protein [Desulfobacterales bacterium]MDH3876535.1 ABC transporter ATP-binding protein [Desulfobacterales bacterium]MDH4009098.1 ABC transporter ATP-binding protein [Desulfobacterales bacterium]
MAFIEIQNLFKRFNDVVAINRIHIEIEKGEMLTLLGPSGCGKTTTLRCIAGLEKPEEGDIIIDGQPMLSQGFVPPAKRGIGMVFQNYAVWPHMKVFSNIVYGLKLQKIPRPKIRERAEQVLELVGLAGLENRYPAQLSGGQQQRVALARALVTHPKVLLLDEPLSNLDAKLREELRFEIKSLVRRMGITAVYVTHDQAEAMVISDRIAVMESGNVVQIGTAQEIYKKPANRFVADFIGTMNFMPGEIVEALPDKDAAHVRTEFSDKMVCMTPDSSAITAGAEVYASIRPEDVEVFTEPPQATENVFKGKIVHKAYLGNFLFFFISVNETMIRVQAPHDLPQEEGQELYLLLDPQKCVVLS